ncbi:F-box domain - like 10 [Theobroma cacao]|nr:F-box domain - like 10 [Theobroma cacao]
MEKTRTSLLLLPDEIVYDILSRLPAKSLQRFKLVSKPWGSLISDPNFAESHLHRANTSHDKNMLRVGQLDLTMGSHPYFSFYSMDSDGSNHDVVTLDYVFRDYHAQILGSCNAVDYEDYFLWNPSTGKYKRIPPAIVSEEANFISGLGYEFTSRNYKAIIVSHLVSGPSSPHSTQGIYGQGKASEVELPEWATDKMKFCLGVLGGCLSISLDLQESFTELRPICFARDNEDEVLMEVTTEISANFTRKRQVVIDADLEKFVESLILKW